MELTNLNITLSKLLVNLAVSTLIIITGFIIAELLSNLIRKTLHEAEVDKLTKKSKVSLVTPIYVITKYFIYILTIVLALNQLGITKTALQLIISIIILVGIILLVLTLKDLLPNSLAAIIIKRKKIIKKGDTITLQNITGKIEHLGLTDIIVKTKNNDMMHFPNKVVLKNIRTIKEKQ